MIGLLATIPDYHMKLGNLPAPLVPISVSAKSKGYEKQIGANFLAECCMFLTYRMLENHTCFKLQLLVYRICVTPLFFKL